MSNETILEELAKCGVKGDQLLIAAIASTGLNKEDLQRFQGPWKRLCGALNSLQESHDQRTKVLALLHEALLQIKVDVKYLQFDLAATKQERDELQRKLDGY